MNQEPLQPTPTPQYEINEHDDDGEPIDVGFQGPFFKITELPVAEQPHAWVDSKLFWGQCAICPVPRAEHQ